MGYDRRGYYYRSRRSGGRVVRDYFGRGPVADAAAYLFDEMRRSRAGNAQRAKAVEAADDLYRRLGGCLDRLAAAQLLAAGHYRHDRGRWRKRRDA